MLKILNSLAIIPLILFCIALSNQCIAQQTAGEKWQVLFNGKDLAGWEMLNGQHKVEVKDGVIVATTVAGLENGYLSTTKSYGDFILELEVKTDLLLDNSGIQYRSLSNSEFMNGRVHGYQVQIENRPPHVSLWSGGIYYEGQGFIYILEDDPRRQKAYIQNQWNNIKIEAIGTTSRVWINGIPTAHILDDKIMSGLIGVQVHGGAHADERGPQSIYVRNVRIQTSDLKPAPYDDIPIVNLIPNNLSTQERQQGFELLFDGTTAKNWQMLAPSDGASTWKIEDGVITIFSSRGKDTHEGNAVAMTANQFGPFELKFDYKLHSNDGIVGVEYFFDPKTPSKRQAIYGRLALDNGKHRAKIDRDIWKEWNQAIIKVSHDNRVEYWLNGYKILEYQRDASTQSNGHILFDGYAGDTISYRSIKIRELKR